MIQCNLDRCQKRYLGETERKLTNRIQNHIGYVKSKITSKATGHNFNLQGHSLANMNVTIIENIIK